MKQKWLAEGGILFPIFGDIVTVEHPGPGVYEVSKSSNPMDSRLGLRKVSDDNFKFDFKIYDLDIEDTMKIALDTWKSNLYKETGKNLGVIFNGIKGTGKTIAAKILCNRLNLPILIVPCNFEGLDVFIQNIEFECAILIDEAEKIFPSNDEDNGNILLKIMDGIYNKSRKFFILTTNYLRVSENLLGRPGRIRYIKEFKNISLTAIEEFIEDNLIDKTKKNEILNLINRLEISTIDILRSVVLEYNIHGKLDNTNPINIPMDPITYKTITFLGMSEEEREFVNEIIKTIPNYRSLTSSPIIAKDAKKFGIDLAKFKKESEISKPSWDDYFEFKFNTDNRYAYRSHISITNNNPEFLEGDLTDRGRIIKSKDEFGITLLENHNKEINLVKILDPIKEVGLYNKLRLTF